MPSPVMKLVVPACPRWAAREVVPIVYGYPGEALVAEAEAGRVVLGGCRVQEGMPTRRCAACGHEWGNLREPGRRERDLR